ncbi:CAAX amino protease [Pullulanibacillus camelliae]|uniref:CAAX amino protease n=1 Tax=Pullulanibacillus camelliae TaxID=1707096 RepID=A0A8J2YEC2_9BACL|nr:CPBP family intramembrane glutamic endopeptidase [Pullulanibacillus camelliae]GGE28102.1 CAAX amino protease [Pullulanibacillus camelliae]
MNKLRYLLKRTPLVTATVTLIIAFIILLTIPTDGSVLQNLRQEILLTLLTLALMTGIDGIQLIKYKKSGITFTFRKSILYLLPGFLLSGATIISAISSKENVQDNWLILVIEAMIFYLLLGLFEEGLFRGIILHAFLDKLGSTRKGLISAVAISGFIFGFVHIVLSWLLTGIDLSVTGLMQAFLKTLSAGMAGFFFGAIYLKTKNLWGIALVHGLSDFLMMLGALLFSGSNSVTFISSDSTQASSSMLINIIFIIVYVPLVISALKQLKSIELPEMGFYNENWKS